MNLTQLETVPGFPPVGGVQAFFIGRIPEVVTAVPREEAMRALAPVHRSLLSHAAGAERPLVTAEQIHGDRVALVKRDPGSPFPGTDGLITDRRGLTLGIHVADCAPVWIVARDGSAAGLLHSGRKGTELGITRKGIEALTGLTGKCPADFLAVIGPCIRPPCYEVDFASDIARQAREEGIAEVHDACICTACHPDLYYSYRREKGLTGRMLATVTLLP